MRVSNYRNPSVSGNSILDKSVRADVDVTTGFLWWRKVRIRTIGRVALGFYYFLDNGDKAPLDTLNLEMAYRLKNGIPDFFTSN